MTENELKQNIARNISSLRRMHNMTQAELAEKLSYSDKSISKWERGDGLPDVFVMTKISELFDVSINDLIADVAPVAPVPDRRKDSSRPRHMLISALSAGLAWFAAALIYFFLKVFIPDSTWAWMVFIYALPVSSIVIVVFTHLWWGIIPRCLSVSALVWSITVCIHLTALVPNLQNATLIYVAAGVFQVLVILWYAYQYVRLKLRHTHDEQQRPTQPASPLPEEEPESGSTDDTSRDPHERN